MLHELILAAVVIGVVAVICYGAYMGGRDAAERAAYATTATLRSQVAQQHLTIERLKEVNQRQARLLAAAQAPRAELPEWMRP